MLIRFCVKQIQQSTTIHLQVRTKKRVEASHNPHPRPRVLTPRGHLFTGEVNIRIMQQHD